MFILFIYLMFIYFQSMSGKGVEREGGTESKAGSRLPQAVSTEPNAGLEPRDCDLSKVVRLTNWGTQAPQDCSPSWRDFTHPHHHEQNPATNKNRVFPSCPAQTCYLIQQIFINEFSCSGSCVTRTRTMRSHKILSAPLRNAYSTLQDPPPIVRLCVSALI